MAPKNVSRPFIAAHSFKEEKSWLSFMFKADRYELLSIV